ncbi:heme peroxidase [Arthrobacter mangrovi]|uniref:Heme peroxidase n=2 Tax=Arthrobacter mangrovi TaxID=2966350 RepID=A0ABQ5MYH2_9MICC|nr:heme peroxidase [Arthrobacter mangrovi]
MSLDNSIARLVAAIETQLPTPLMDRPTGWPGQIESALIDAVLSIRANYGSPTTGVRAAVRRYKDDVQDDKPNDLRRLAEFDPDKLAQVLGNRQVISGSLKAKCIIQAAANLARIGVQNSDDLDARDKEHKLAYVSVHGLGWVTWEYFTMLLGLPGIKADTWIVRFVSQALARTVTPAEARSLLVASAEVLRIDATQLDHAIWDHVRRRASSTREG